MVQNVMFSQTSNTRKLSIGHLFHLISLDEDSIAVTSYRQIDKLIKISYSYALQVPDAKSYVSFHTNFTSDSTVILNWNYLDNYLCNRGISDSFRLLPNLKFWRSRFFVLPIFSNETRRLTEAIRDNLTGQRIPCDVYESDYMNINREKTCEKFVHFIESINRVRRVLITSRKLNRQKFVKKIEFPSFPHGLTTVYKLLKIINTTGSLNETNEQNIQLISSRTVNQASMVKTDNFCSTTSLPNISGMSYQSTEDQTINSGQIVHNTPTIINTSLLNSNTKNVYYLVALMMVDNDTYPVMQMLEAGWICHTSGNTKHAFIYGTYFYTLLIPDVNQLTCTQVETLDNNELNVHSAPVTPIQLNTSTSNYAITSFINPSQLVSGLDSSLFLLATTTVTPLGTSSNTIHCLPSPTSIVPATNHNNAIILNNLPTSTNTTIQLGSITNTISSFAAVTPSTCTNTTINSTITNVLLSTATTTTNSSLLSTVKQNELTKNLPIHSFKTLSNIVDLNVLQQSPMQFPKDYIPKLLSDTTKWTRVFQNEWAEISIVHYGSNECQLKQHQQQNTSSKQINDNNNNHSSGGTSSLPTSPTTSTTTTHVSCPSVSTSEIHFEHVKEELYSFFKDGLLTYSSISALFGILDKTGFQEIDQILRKSCLCDLDGPNNDGPVEWAHCVYDANYHPTCAFSIELQWLVVSGGRMAELVSLWHQKAGTANLHFFPVPCYPFGHLNADLSDKDPLRKPIFLPVNVSVLMETAKTFYYNQSFSVNSSMLDENNMSITDSLNYLFPDIPRSERLTCLRFFQDCILRRFGFINDTCVKDRLDFELRSRLAFTSCCSQKQWIYVHCSGGIFTMIPLYKNDDIQNEDSAKTSPMTVDSSGGRKTEESDHNIDLSRDDNKQTINMSTTWTSLDCSENCFLPQSTIGYFWAWNHMLPKRWRGYLTGDELFQDSMLSDFRIFLNGNDDRLSQSFNDFLKTIFINHSVC
ncbi:GATOR complex protein DEPDC5 [Schistosoma japonicum]|nr:GATOR complex protein DEPDC5 [Schistosoma japonicum]